jgi:hypothetical protein
VKNELSHYSLGYIIYRLIFSFYRFVICRLHPEITAIWYRNSLALGYWSFGRSDIDVTIHVHTLPIELGRKIASTHEFFRKNLKVIGELVIYSDTHKAALLECLNFYEGQRDPLLQKKKKESEYLAEKIVFLHKFLVSNWKHAESLKTRPGKMKYMLGICNVENTRSDIDTLKKEIEFLIDENFNEKIEKLYSDIIVHRKGPDDLQNLKTYGFLFYNEFCYLSYLTSTATSLEKEIMVATIKWELWGCFTHRFIGNEENIKLHIKRVIENSKNVLDTYQFAEIEKLALELDFL